MSCVSRLGLRCIGGIIMTIAFFSTGVLYYFDAAGVHGKDTTKKPTVVHDEQIG